MTSRTTLEEPACDVSVICSVGRLAGDLGAVHRAFAEVIGRSGRTASTSTSGWSAIRPSGGGTS